MSFAQIYYFPLWHILPPVPSLRYLYSLAPDYRQVSANRHWAIAQIWCQGKLRQLVSRQTNLLRTFYTVPQAEHRVRDFYVYDASVRSLAQRTRWEHFNTNRCVASMKSNCEKLTIIIACLCCADLFYSKKLALSLIFLSSTLALSRSSSVLMFCCRSLSIYDCFSVARDHCFCLLNMRL